MTYAEKLKDPRWQKKRLSVFKRDKWKCVKCANDKTTLHVHHIYYRSGFEPWEYPMEVLQTLCEPCHKAKHPEPTPAAAHRIVGAAEGREFFRKIREALLQ